MVVEWAGAWALLRAALKDLSRVLEMAWHLVEMSAEKVAMSAACWAHQWVEKMDLCSAVLRVASKEQQLAELTVPRWVALRAVH